MTRFLFASSLLAALAIAGCEPSAPSGPPRLGVPDPMHGPSTDDDLDGDGVSNANDNCPSIANADQRNACDYVFPPPEPGGVDPVADVLERINFWRNAVGLDPVTEEPMLSAGCAAHANYMAETTTSPTMPNLTREEDTASEHYSAEGAAAGAVALLSYTRYPVNDITRFVDLVFHRWALLQPGLTQVGVAFDRNFLCIRADMVGDPPAGIHPILWPPPDSAYASNAFPGGEFPCMSWDDPTMGEECMPSAMMPSILVPGHTIGPVTGSVTRVDTGDEVMLLRAYHDGGSSDIEGSNLFDGAILLATPEGGTMAPTEHEVRIDTTIDGVAQTFRWRFRTGPAIDQEIACDVFSRSNYSFEYAVDVTPSSGFGARICGMPMFYRLQRAGNYRITIDYDPRVGDLELHAYDASRVEVGALGAENDGHEVIENVPGMGWFEIRGRDNAMGAYIVLVETI